MHVPAHRIGDWVLDHATLRLARDGTEHRLPRLQYDLLCALLEQAGRLVSRDTLIERAWQRRVVGDEVLSRQVASLRQLLGDDAREPRYIETVPKAGYRLLAPVVALAAPQPAPDVDPPAPPPTGATVPAATAIARRRPVAIVALGLVLLAIAVALGLRHADDGASPAWTPDAMARERPLASDPALESAPRLSRDGRWLAYAWRQPGAATSIVRLSRADGGGARDLFEAEGVVTAFAFAPDATALAFIEAGANGCRVRRWSLPEGPLHTLHACGSARGLDWSPDGAWLAFTAPAPDTPGGQGLLALPLAGGAAIALTWPGADDAVDALPRWSGDGARLAFARGVEGEQQLFVAARDGGGAACLGPDDRNRITALAWSADQGQLLVAMDPAGSPALFAIDARSGARTWLGARGIANLDLAPGAGLVHEQRRYDANIWRRPLDGTGAPSRLTPSARYDAQPALSPDARRVAYASNRDGAGAAWIVDADGRETRLALPGEGIWTRPAWSPDGTRLLLTHYVDGKPRAALHALENGATTILAPPDAAAATFAADGSIVAIVRADGAPRLARWREGGSPLEIAGSEGVVEFRLGGPFVAWVGAESPAIRVARLDAPGAARTIDLAPLEVVDWCFAGATLAVLAGEPGRGDATLWRIDPERDAREAVATLPAPGVGGPGLAVAPDWRFALQVRVDGLEADLWRVPPPAR